MLTLQEAREKLCKMASQFHRPHEHHTLADSHLRYCAHELLALTNSPPTSNSAMDGYAINTSSSRGLKQLPISQVISAGTAPSPLTPGTAARILTGATLPEGSDCVVIQENCHLDPQKNTISILTPTSSGDNIREQGQDAKIGSPVAKVGERLTASKIALLAATGHSQLATFANIKIAVINTGTELIQPGKTLQRGQIYNTNQLMLTQLVQQWGCQVTQTHTVLDNLDATIHCLKNAANHVDLIITSGGVSVGDEDHMKAAIDTLGQIDTWKVKLKPGKPLAFGHLAHPSGITPIIALPGNPVSCFVNALLFVQPFIAALNGSPYQPINFHFGTAQFTITKPNKRPEFIRARLQQGQLHRFPNQSSGAISSIAWANALALVNENTIVTPGDSIAYIPLDPTIY